MSARALSRPCWPRRTGKCVAQAQAGYPTHHPRPGWAEQDPDDWWQGVVAVTRQVTAAVTGTIAGHRRQRARLCRDADRPRRGRAASCHHLDGQPLRAPVRAAAAVAARRQILHINGKSPAPYNADPVLMWLQEHLPSVIDAAHCSLTTTGYINFRLTGETGY